MSILFWFVITILFLLSFVGIIMPIIPGIPLIWIGLLIYHFGIAPIIGWNFWLTTIILSVLILIVDYLASSTWVKKQGGSKAGAWSAVGGILLGPFIFGPIGVILGPFIFVTITELLLGKKILKAVKVGLASLVGFLGGSILKGILQLLIIIIFFIAI